MRLPNGYGSVTKLKGKRRNPWAVRKSVHNKDGSVSTVYVGYYATRSDALDALARYNKSPYRSVTIGEIYDKWVETTNASASSIRTYEAAYSHLGPIAKRDMSRVRLDDLQEIFDGMTKASGRALRSVLSGVYSYAVRHEYVTPERANMIKYIKIGERKDRSVSRSVFSAEEIAECKDHAVRVLLYTGLRISELLGMTADCVHIEERYLDVRKSKTAAGVRKVPIAEKIVNDVKALDCFGMGYETFKRHHFHYENHTVHDTRHTFISMCANASPPIDPRITKAIVGHAGTDITETVYTHIDLDVLKNAVNRL